MDGSHRSCMQVQHQQLIKRLENEVQQQQLLLKAAPQKSEDMIRLTKSKAENEYRPQLEAQAAEITQLQKQVQAKAEQLEDAQNAFKVKLSSLKCSGCTNRQKLCITAKIRRI